MPPYRKSFFSSLVIIVLAVQLGQIPSKNYIKIVLALPLRFMHENDARTRGAWLEQEKLAAESLGHTRQDDQPA